LTLALNAARGAWVVAVGGALLSSDIKFLGLESLRSVTHYGKLDDESRERPAWVTQLARWSLPARRVWVTYYTIGALNNLLCLCLRPCTALGLMQVHFLRRIYESVFVTRFSATRRDHPMTYLAGCGFYVILSPGVALENALAGNRTTLPMMTTGVVLFFIGNFAQHHAHRQLADLRKGDQTGSRQYKVPRGWLFRNISCCPHYTSEILVYLSLVLQTNFSRCSCGALAFTLLTLSITALRTRKWYGKIQGNQAMSPYAIIPGVL